MEPFENKQCFESERQRELLAELTTGLERYYLAGGTALSVFYLHHRTSEDLDFFTVEEDSVEAAETWVKQSYPRCVVRKSSEHFASFTVDGVKVDLAVVAGPEIMEERHRVTVNGASVVVDTFRNILANKLTMLISRCEPKDVVDFHFAWSRGFFNHEQIFEDAKRRESAFDDLINAAYEIERGLKQVLHQEPWPKPLSGEAEFDREAILYSGKQWVNWLYERGGREAGLS